MNKKLKYLSKSIKESFDINEINKIANFMLIMLFSIN